MPIPRPRWRALNQSRTTRTQEENIGASPMPRNTRATLNWVKLPTRPAAACARDQIVSPEASSRRGPIRSISAPLGSWKKA
jgi:hypothetical protein